MKTPALWYPIYQSPRILLAIAAFALFSGCSGGSDDSNGFQELVEEAAPVIVLPGCADDGSCASNPPTMIGTERPAEVQIPSDYTASTRYPLIIVLHGYGASGAVQSAYIGLSDRVDSKQYVLVAPDGTANANGTRFWNATPACCAGVAAQSDNAGEDYSQIDDVAYIRSLIEEAAATYSIDTTRIGLFGHSNGGFMALRMACESSDYVTALVSLAGSTFEDSATCAPATNPVSVLTIHGDLDGTIPYDGSSLTSFTFPGAIETSERFASLAGCDSGNPLMLDDIDVVGAIDGSETTVLSYSNCSDDTSVEFWTIVGGPHIPAPWVPSAQDSFVDWLIEHPRG
ncbi:MAG: PHB depolymerase family esterase [Pseudomonadales bacterium]